MFSTNILIKFTASFLDSVQEVYSALEKSGVEYRVLERIQYDPAAGLKMFISLRANVWDKSVESLQDILNDVYLRGKQEEIKTGEEEVSWFEFKPYLIKAQGLQPILDYCEQLDVNVVFDAYNSIGFESGLRVMESHLANRNLERDTIELSKHDGTAWPIEVLCHELGHLHAWRSGLDHFDEVLAWDLGEEIYKKLYPGKSLRRMRLIRKFYLKSYGIVE